MKGVLGKVIKLAFAVLLIINTIPRNLYAEEPETVPVQESVDVPVEESVETPAEEVVVETVSEAEPNAPPENVTAKTAEAPAKKDESVENNDKQPVSDSAPAEQSTEPANNDSTVLEEKDESKNAEQNSALLATPNSEKDVVEGSADNSESVTTETSKKYLVLFYVDDKEFYRVEIEEGTAIGENNMPQEDPVKENSTFDKWIDKDDNPITKDTIVNAEIKANARFVENEPARRGEGENNITITYIAGDNGSVSLASEIVDLSAETITANGSTAEANEGYVFLNWTNESGEVVSTNAALTISELKLTSGSSDMSFTANFVLDEEVEPEDTTQEETKETFIVIYMSGDDIFDVKENVEKDTLVASILPETDPSKEGYRFDGWDFTEGQKVTENVTINAKFVKVWTVTFVNRDGEATSTEILDDGSSIAMPEVIAREDYIAYWAEGIAKSGIDSGFTPTQRIGGKGTSYTVSKDVTIGPDYDKISYTVTFYKEDKTTKIDTKNVTADTSYCLNDIPAVPGKQGYVGKWVYSGGDFNNQVTIKTDTDVWAEYVQNVFTVTFKVNGSVYETDTYYSGDTLILPAEPAVEGKEFDGWYLGETKYVGGEVVNSDLTLEAKLKDEYTVRFIIKNGEEISETLSQYFRAKGEEIGVMPQDPFIAGKVFEKWADEETGSEVTAKTVVNANMNVVAVFRDVKVYTITAEYFYKNNSGNEVIFNTDLLSVEGHELPYTITAVATTQTDPNQVPGGPIYYASTPTVVVKETDFDEDFKCTVRVEYVSHTAVYDFVYLLKDLSGSGYTEIERTEDIQGVKGSYVTPIPKTYDYAVLEKAEGAIITKSGMDGEEKQELPVYYTRKNFSLSYDSLGGSYVGGVTVPYGTDQALSSTVPTRNGYNFVGWYDAVDDETGEATGNRVTGSIEIKENTTLYAKWEGKTVNYTIVYMFEKYNDAGTESSYVYDNSETGTARVGITKKATDRDIPDKSRTGWEKDTEKNAHSEVVIEADGSSVLYVYYKLTEYTFRFNAGTRIYYYSSWQGWTYINETVTATLKGKGSSGTGLLSYSFKAKLGQDISKLWPDATGRFGRPSTNVALRGWHKPGDSDGMTQDNTQVLLTEGLIPSSGSEITYTAYWVVMQQ